MQTLRSRHWVIGDVHGCHAQLLALLAVLPCQDHLVFCGDVINRGSEIEACMNLVWGLVTLRRATWLRGNHEQALIEALESRGDEAHAALLQLDTYRQLGDGLARQWLHRLNQLPLLYRAVGWCATHAGFNRAGEPDLSIREPFWDSYDGRYGLAVVGHTPRPRVERHGRIVLIDTAAVHGGFLSAYCPETDAVVQVRGPTCAPDQQWQLPDDRLGEPVLLRGDGASC